MISSYGALLRASSVGPESQGWRAHSVQGSPQALARAVCSKTSREWGWVLTLDIHSISGDNVLFKLSAVAT